MFRRAPDQAEQKIQGRSPQRCETLHSHRRGLCFPAALPIGLHQIFLRIAFWAVCAGHLTDQTHILALQTGEPGPLSQAIAGIDCAVHDLAARKQGLPLWRYLGGEQGEVKVYASGINPAGALDTVKSAHAQGFRSFKLKVGFTQETDLENC